MNFDATNILKKIANKEYQIHEFAKEFGAIAFVFLILKFATSLVSITAGYNFMHNVFYTLIENIFWSVTFAILFLALVELLNMYILSKAFKFAFHGKILAAIVLSIVALGVFSLSSYISIQGLKQFTSQKVDNTENIVNNFSLLLENLTNEHNAIIDNYKEEINTIKNNPEGWQHGKRAVLTSEQQSNIRTINANITAENDRYFKAKQELNQAKEKELLNNNSDTENLSNKYMWYVGVIMFLQFGCNGGLMFFWSKIYNENEKDKVIQEAVSDIRDNVVSKAVDSIIDSINKIGSKLVGGFSLIKDYEIKNTPQPNTPTAEQKKKTPILKPQAPIGFNVAKVNTDTNTEHGNNGPVVNEKTQPKTEHGTQQKVCDYCHQTFTPKAWNQRFCCPEHKDKFWNNNGLDIEKIKLRNNKKRK